MLFATLPGFAWFSLKIGSGVTALVRVDHKETIIDIVLFYILLLCLFNCHRTRFYQNVPSGLWNMSMRAMKVFQKSIEIHDQNRSTN